MDEPYTLDKREALEQGQPAIPGPVSVQPPPALLAEGTERHTVEKSSGDDSGKGGLSEDSGTKELRSALPILSQTPTVIVRPPTPSIQHSTSLASSVRRVPSENKPESVRQEDSICAIPSTPPKSGTGSKWRRRLSVLGLGQFDTEGTITGGSSTAGESSGTIGRSEASGPGGLKVSKTGTLLRRSKPVLLAKKYRQNIRDFFNKDSGQTMSEGGGIVEPEAEGRGKGKSLGK